MRTLKFNIFRFNPKIDKKAVFDTYIIEETDSMTLFIALNKIRETIASDLSYDFVCRAGICGSCGMMVNGKPKLACKTLTNSYKDGEITLAPMPTFEIIKDLSVNTGKWMEGMNKKVESWVHTNELTDISRLEKAIPQDTANEVFELDRCIECGICLASCGTKLMRENFIGAVGLNRVARFHTDPNDERTDENFYDLVGDDDGIFGCMSLMGCEDHCPKNLPLQSKIAYMRRKLVSC